MMVRCYGLIFCLLLLFACPAVAEDMVFTYRAPESIKDSRFNYDTSVLELALEKTREKWGGYVLVPSPVMNFPRAMDFLKGQELENPMFKLSASNELCSKYEYVPFPIDLGIVGYRLFLVSGRVNSRLETVRSLEDLKNFTIGQGAGWLDTEILTEAGFKVMSVPNYESLFNMVVEERFDLFPRGVNEVELEYKSHEDILDIRLSRTVGIHYPLPRFFFTNRKSAQAAKRVYEGLVMAFEDGSLQALWKKNYESSLKFANMDEIIFYEINNPLIDEVDPSYQKYMTQCGISR